MLCFAKAGAVKGFADGWVNVKQAEIFKCADLGGRNVSWQDKMFNPFIKDKYIEYGGITNNSFKVNGIIDGEPVLRVSDLSEAGYIYERCL